MDMETKLFDSELKVMEVLWREGDLTAGQSSVHVRILGDDGGDSGWLDCNRPYDGNGAPQGDGSASAMLEPAMPCHRYITLGQGRCGTCWVRVGLAAAARAATGGPV